MVLLKFFVFFIVVMLLQFLLIFIEDYYFSERRLNELVAKVASKIEIEPFEVIDKNISSNLLLEPAFVATYHVKSYSTFGGFGNATKVMTDSTVVPSPTTAQSLGDIEFVSPVTFLNLAHRFDIIVKAVYAFHLNKSGNVLPKFVAAAYKRHLQVWNQFQEPCIFNGDRDWFDSRSKCVKKSTADDFIQSFHRLMNSVKSKGFDSSKSLVPVAAVSRFPLNGAHRVAAAIALNSSLPVQLIQSDKMKAADYAWGYEFFERLNMETMYQDYVVLEFALLVPEVSVINVWPEAASMQNLLPKAREIVGKQCAVNGHGIVYEKQRMVTKKSLAMLVRHAYGNEPWIEAKIAQLQRLFGASSADEQQLPFLSFFVIQPDVGVLAKCKNELRELFSLCEPKSSVHIPDTHAEVKILAEMILNDNSFQFLQAGSSPSRCQAVGVELARRYTVPKTVLPGIFVLPPTIMVDSGTVMSYFGLRPGSDVDLLFNGPINYSVLGSANNWLVEAHPFASNKRPGERAWGSYHFKPNSPCVDEDDLFHNPTNYGYCFGSKFVSLSQLVRYKQNRNEKGKDDRDIQLIIEQNLFSTV